MSASLFQLKGKTALVTGASYGLGADMARTLAEAGANVVLTARSADKLEQVAQGMNDLDVRALPLTCDVTDTDSVAGMMDVAWKEMGSIDILLNNAGQLLDGGMVPEKITDDLLEQTLKVNVMGTFRCARELAARQLKAGVKGSIINMASVTGFAGGNHPMGYATSKAAVINLTQVLAASWADRGVRVNALCPGYFPSEITGPWLSVPDIAHFMAGSTPMGRVGQNGELAGPLLFLASDASSYVTGHALAVDGGMASSLGFRRMGGKLDEMIASVVGDVGVPIKPEG